MLESERHPVSSWGPVRTSLQLSAYRTWICLALMTVAVKILFSVFAKTGVNMAYGQPPEHFPEGVIAIAGWADR